MAWADFEDSGGRFDDLVALHTADDAGELHRRLLCRSRGSSRATPEKCAG